MATVLSKGVIVPDPGETDWAGYLAINWGKLNDVVGAALPDVQNIWTQPQIYQNNIYLTNTSYTVGTIPDSNITTTLSFTGASNYQIGYCRGVVYRTTGQTSAELTARNKFTNGVLDPAGSYINATFTVNLDADGTRWVQFANSSIKNGLVPYATDTYNIGSAANQWLRLFAKFYYYNGVAWGLDQNNTWTGSNTFSSILNQNINSIYSEIPSSDHFAVKGVTDNNGNNIFVISFADRSSGQRDLTLRVYDTNGVSQGVGLYKNSDSSHDFKPMSNGLVNLGTSTNKWKTLNGINPGALSLPSGDWVILDKANITTDGTYSYITASIDGWLYMSIADTLIKTEGELTVFNGNTALYGQNFVCSTDGYVRITIPVHNGFRIRFRVNANGGTPVVNNLVIYNCLGNV